MKKIFTAAATALALGGGFLSISADEAQAQSRNCAPREILLERAEDRFGETRQLGAGRIEGSNIPMAYELLANEETGSWTLIKTNAIADPGRRFPAGIACAILTGENFTIVEEDPAPWGILANLPDAPDMRLEDGVSTTIDANFLPVQQAPGQPAPQQQVCAPRDEMARNLSQGSSEARQAYGLVGTTGTGTVGVALMEVYANEDTGAWTILRTAADTGIACMVAGGNFGYTEYFNIAMAAPLPSPGDDSGSLLEEEPSIGTSGNRMALNDDSSAVGRHFSHARPY